VASRKEVLTVPRAAVMQEGSEKLVFRLEGDKARRARISIGLDDGQLVEVLQGLAVGDVVLVGPVRDGEVVPR